MSIPSPDNPDLTKTAPLRRGTDRPLPSYGFRIPQRHPVVEHVPRRKQDSPWGRFRPYIGGDNANKLFLTPGTVRYCRLADEDREDGTDPEAQQERPIYPTLSGTRLNAEEPPSFGLGSRSSASLWLCTQRLQCGSNIPGSDDPERIEIHNRGDKPERVPGELHTLLCEMDFESEGGGSKSIKDLDTRILSDLDVWYKCWSDDSSGDGNSGPDSDELNSSELSDDPNDSSDSGSDPQCKWDFTAEWYNKQKCYSKNRTAIIGVVVKIELGGLYRRCKNWTAYISAPPGQVKTSMLEDGQSVTNGGELKVAIKGRRAVIRGRFYFVNPPCKTKQIVRVRITSEQKGDPSPEHECCGITLGPKEYNIGLWPGWCEYGTDGSSCGTTLLPPPPPP